MTAASPSCVSVPLTPPVSPTTWKTTACAFAILASAPGRTMSSGSVRLTLLVGGAGMNAARGASGETGLLKSRFGFRNDGVLGIARSIGFVGSILGGDNHFSHFQRARRRLFWA